MTDPRIGVMARAALFPTQLVQTFLAGTRPEIQRLSDLASHQGFMEALTIASPTLADELAGVHPGWPEKRLRSLMGGVTRYLLRATTRCTPFGAFAGVRALPVGEDTALTLGELGAHRKTLRVDAQQVWQLVKQLEERGALVDDLYVYANPTLYQRGERLRLPYQDTYGQGRDSMQLSLRATPVVARVMELAARPVQLRALLGRLQEEYSDAPLSYIRPFVLKLAEQQVLLSTLRPPMTESDPLRYVAQVTPATEAAQDLRAHMTTLLDLTRQYNETAVGEGVRTLRALLDELKFESGQAQRHVQVDTRLDASGTFGRGDLQALSEAARALTRLLPQPSHSHLTEFADAFLERYGNREVPLLELLDPDYGLGAPAGYANPASTRTVSAPPHDRNALIHRVLARAAGSGAVDLQAEGLVPDEERPLPESIDAFVRRAPREDGEAWLVLEGLHGPGGNTFGRFTHVDPELHAHWLVRARQEEAVSDLIVSDLVYSEGSGHANNVAIHAPIYQHQTAVASTPGVPHDRHIMPSDVMVGVQGGRFYFRSRSRGVQLRFRTPHVLNPALAPNVVRFLQECSEMHAPEVPHWSWEGAAELGQLPRVTYGRVVLSPARWRLPRTVIEAEDFATALGQYRMTCGLPRFAYAGRGDNRLLLDLDAPLCQEMLRGIVSKESEVLDEALGDYNSVEGRSPAGRHAVQYVVTFPLAGVTLPHVAPRVDERPDESLRWILPFQGGVYLKLYGPHIMQDDVITAMQAATALAFAECGALAPQPDAWFFIRYADPDHHVRWRLFGAGPVFEATAQRLLREAAVLQQRGLVTRVELASYEREIERYGGNAGVQVSEGIFAADSAWLAELLGGAMPAGDARLPFVAATADGLLDALQLDAPTRRWALEMACAGYRQEFTRTPGDTEHIERVLSQDARQHRAAVWQHLAGLYPAHGELLLPGTALLRERLAPLVPAFHPMVDRTRDPERAALMLSSFMHMHANRAQLDRFQEFRALNLLLKTHQGFAHHLPRTLDPRAFQDNSAPRFPATPARKGAHA